MSEPPDRQRTLLGHIDANPARPSTGQTRSRASTAFAASVAVLLRDRHMEAIVVFDLTGLSDITDCIVIATGTSERQIRSVGREVIHFGAAQNMDAFRHQNDVPATWAIIDFVDVVVHLFNAETRAFYDLEMMWGDATVIDWETTQHP